MVVSLRWLNPVTSAFMLHYRWTTDSKVYYVWVDRQQISEHLAIAAVAAEDQRFPQHRGVDFTEVKNAVLDYLDGEKLRGASTISQQLAKNLFLWNGRSIARKLLEVYFATLIEWLWGKERILEVYLNVIEFGEGVYGVEAASQIYFNRSAKQVNLQQASLLMAVLPNPKVYNLYQPSRYHQQRARSIERDTRALGGIQYLRK